MIRKTFKKLIVLITVFMLFCINTSSAFAQAQPNDLFVVYEDSPLFSEPDVKPCDVYTKTMTVTNTSTTVTYLFGIATFDEIDPDNFAGILSVRIYDGSGTNIYGGPTNPKTLADLFTETAYSDNPSTPGTEVLLLTLTPGATATLTMEVKLDCAVGNEWQAKTTTFSFGTGWTGSVMGEKTEDKGDVKSAQTGQSILAGLAIGTGLILIGRRLLKKKSGMQGRRKTFMQ